MPEIKSMSTATMEKDICALTSPLGLFPTEEARPLLPLIE
jgi:hypothetical protein